MIGSIGSYSLARDIVAAARLAISKTKKSRMFYKRFDKELNINSNATVGNFVPKINEMRFKFKARLFSWAKMCDYKSHVMLKLTRYSRFAHFS